MKTNPSYCLILIIIEVFITTLLSPLASVNNVVSVLPVIILYPTILFAAVQSLNLPPPKKRSHHKRKFVSSSDSDTSSSSSTTTRTTKMMSSSSSSSKEQRQDNSDSDSSIVLTSKCACGSLCLKITIPQKEFYDNNNHNHNHNNAVDCHCTNCRHYHVSGFTSYLQIPADTSSSTSSSTVKWTTTNISNNNNKNIKASYRDTCDQLGIVERIYCSNCKTKMATQQQQQQQQVLLLEDDDDDGNDKAASKKKKVVLLVNLGSVQDESIPTDIALKWQTNRQQWQLNSKQYWPYAIPSSSLPVNNDSNNNNNKNNNNKKKKKRRDTQPTTTTTLPNIIKGGCRCGQCKYLINFGGGGRRQNPMQQQKTEFQHCYCKLCRQLSGSAFQTWVPIMESNFQWIESNGLQLIRTTDHGRRHICRICGSVMTIKYDSQPDAIWPAAGSWDDDNFDFDQYDQRGDDNDNDDDDNNNNKQIIQYYDYYPVDYLYRVCHICVAWKQDWYQIPVDDGLERIQYAC